jgi:hypothetical protein
VQTLFKTFISRNINTGDKGNLRNINTIKGEISKILKCRECWKILRTKRWSKAIKFKSKNVIQSEI